MIKAILEIVAKVIGAIAVGACFAVIGTLLHNSFHPFGLIAALLICGIGFFNYGKVTKGLILRLIAVATWFFFLIKAASFGVSQEILIEGNAYGYIYLFGGAISVFLGLARARRY